jgi:DNA-dependent protein kinase catalytic subunit
MNEIFVHTAATCKRRLAIKTYQVVPMTGKVGMIEWLNDTRPLKVSRPPATNCISCQRS